MIRYVQAEPLYWRDLLFWLPVYAVSGALLTGAVILMGGLVLMFEKRMMPLGSLVAIVVFALAFCIFILVASASSFCHRRHPLWRSIVFIVVESAALWDSVVVSFAVIALLGSRMIDTFAVTVTCTVLFCVTAITNIGLLVFLNKLFPPSPWLKARRTDCPGCGYSLIGLRDHRCPECGRAFTLEELGITEAYLKPHKL